MATNLNDLRARLAALTDRTKKANDIWKPKPGKHVARLLPYPHGGDPIVLVSFHYDIGEGTIVCPKENFGEDCSVCDFANKLKSWKTEEGVDKKESDRKFDWELFRKIQTKQRAFVPVAVRDGEGFLEGKAKFWSITPKMAQSLLEKCADPERLAALGIKVDDSDAALKVFFDPDRAFDMEVEVKETTYKDASGKDRKGGNTEFNGKIMPTPVHRDKKTRDAIMASVKNIWDVYPKETSEDVEKKLVRFVGGSSPAAKPEGGTEKYGGSNGGKAEEKPAVNSGENSKTVGKRSIDEAFGEMVGETAAA